MNKKGVLSIISIVAIIICSCLIIEYSNANSSANKSKTNFSYIEIESFNELNEKSDVILEVERFGDVSNYIYKENIPMKISQIRIYDKVKDNLKINVDEIKIIQTDNEHEKTLDLDKRYLIFARKSSDIDIEDLYVPVAIFPVNTTSTSAKNKSIVGESNLEADDLKVPKLFKELEGDYDNVKKNLRKN